MAISERAARRALRPLVERADLRPRPGPRLLVPIVAFGVAFGLDVLTDRRWSSVLGSVALVASAAVFPWIRRLLVPVAAYAGVWVGFNALRAFADDLGIGLAGRGAVSRLDSWLWGGELPSELAQRALVDPGSVGAHEVGVTTVYLSYFVVPHAVGAVLLWRSRARFPRYLGATTVLFALGLVGFLLLPTDPPWMASQPRGEEVGGIERVPDRTLAAAGIDLRSEGAAGQGYAFEPNPVASMPSMHLGITALIAVLAWNSRRAWRWLGVGYALAMAYALVVSGEHYTLDIVAGAAAAMVAWRVSARWPVARSPNDHAIAARGGSPPSPAVGLARMHGHGSAPETGRR